MKLSELNPKFWEQGGMGYLAFDCPHSKDCDHRIAGLPVLPTGQAKDGWVGPVWQMDGTPPDWDSITLHPSINYHGGHWHGFIRQGNTVDA